MDNKWILSRDVYDHDTRAGMEPVFTIGNGYICARGFFEEEQEGIAALGGIYMAGVFGSARYQPWKGEGRELANTPNIFYTSITVDGEQVIIKEDNMTDFNISLNMKESTLVRSFKWESKQGQKIKIKFERFISGANKHVAGQKISITPIQCNPDIKIQMDIQTDIKNLNYISCEPWPVQPGVKHIETTSRIRKIIETVIDKPEEVALVYGQKVDASIDKSLYNEDCQQDGYVYTYRGKANEIAQFSKLIYIYTSNVVDDPLSLVKKAMDVGTTYEAELDKHRDAWEQKWHVSDISIHGNDEDQVTLRYNIFQLMQSCPEHTSKLSIGARGLTGEMYEGCIFWDTEIFMVPFFTYTNPDAARKLLEFRYHTLPEARQHAISNWFKGAMYGWQVSEKGIEQTPHGVGAYYSIHVVADIAFAILEYWFATYDEAFMSTRGVEILIETARFWESRVHKNTQTGKYDILAVRGPNEYDVIVNNNVYTNMMAQQNMIIAKNIITMMKEKYSDKWEMLSKKLDFKEEEIAAWKEIADNILICYNEALDLYEEDDMYLNRVPLDMNQAKPTAKRIIDTTIPYEGLMLYQVTKQADVLHLMKNLHWRFTKEQMKNAWDYYVPKTCHDSSLSYSMHSVMASKLGLSEEAYTFFNTSANLDIRDVQLNTVSGLHFANFGGTWQAVIFGFGGLSIDEEGINMNPCIPKQWDQLAFKFWYKNNLLRANISHSAIEISVEKYIGQPIPIRLIDNEYILDEDNQKLILHKKDGQYEKI